MTELIVALNIEFLKARKSKVTLGTILFFAFMGVMMGVLTLTVKHPELMGKSAILGAKASMIQRADWTSYFGLLLQIVLTAGSFGFGLAASWIFAREFVDRVVKDLLALPVSRVTIVWAKFLVMISWDLILAFILLAVGLIMGQIVGLSGWSNALFYDFLIRFMGCSLLTILVCTPFSFFASFSRGYLLPISLVILMLMVTQLVFLGLPMVSPYFPWAIPALFSEVAGNMALPATQVSYLILIVTSLAGIAVTMAWWRFADHH